MNAGIGLKADMTTAEPALMDPWFSSDRQRHTNRHAHTHTHTRSLTEVCCQHQYRSYSSKALLPFVSPRLLSSSLHTFTYMMVQKGGERTPVSNKVSVKEQNSIRLQGVTVVNFKVSEHDCLLSLPYPQKELFY